MSSIVGAKAIRLVLDEEILARPHARVFVVRGYTVVIGAHEPGGPGDVCTCPAGQRGLRCSHARAAHLLLARERDTRPVEST